MEFEISIFKCPPKNELISVSGLASRGLFNLSPSPSQPLIASNWTNSCIIPKFKIAWTGSVSQFQNWLPQNDLVLLCYDEASVSSKKPRREPVGNPNVSCAPWAGWENGSKFWREFQFWKQSILIASASNTLEAFIVLQYRCYEHEYMRNIF